ncbi:hypothetical protein [Listeria booriae]|uniref:Uncharacterized protein n=1 Tax=Listeria booriae TaxID=1552123 RepID=A0A7X1CN34_9LIST|nr:hypothetical protein [Listeria booriae]MBC1794804.1 hypothetical protein [Listeria booriae]MBC1801832.1 hypothetical protein [Listeria booriae]MBC1804080.1 hypothetical protein [Listeria booriae]MBC2196113.1 hypothetical protein [Listeria booriae]MBC2259865.1 hypothetical protein [Listeria booriae]
MSNSIEINPTVLESEVAYLKSLLTSKIVITQDISSSGQAADSVKLLLDYIVTLESSLDTLIKNTADFLDNARDSYIDVDEESGAILSKLLEGTS